MTEQVIVVPDIGTDDEVSVIEINVNVGDKVEEEDTLITLESEKASMEIPAPMTGTVANITVSVGDKVKTGTSIMTFTNDEIAAKEASTEENQLTVDEEEPLETKSTLQVSDSDTINKETQAKISKDQSQRL